MTRRRAALGGLALAVFTSASPPPGDIGGCGQSARDLDPGTFYETRRVTLCRRCAECGSSAQDCEALCSAEGRPSDFPPGCFPLVHDGTVCLRALLVTSCDKLPELIAEPPSIPSECDFCPQEGS